MTAGEREFSVGDRIFTRRNDRHHDVDNGTRGTVRTVDPAARELVMESDAGGLHRLPADYLAAHTEYAYALTGHGMQGGTVEWAAAVGTPEDFTRNWSYTGLSRGRELTRLYVAEDLPAPAREGAEVAPEAPAEPGPALARLARAMRTPDDEPLALELLEAHEPPQLPDAADAPSDVAGLRAELATLEARLASYPDSLADALNRARAARTDAEQSLERANARLAERERERPRWWRRVATPDPREIAFAEDNREQAQRNIEAATERERELAPEVPDRAQWEAEHAPLRERAGELRRQLAEGRDRHVERELENPSKEIVEALGERPRDEWSRGEWDRGARGRRLPLRAHTHRRGTAGRAARRPGGAARLAGGPQRARARPAPARMRARAGT